MDTNLNVSNGKRETLCYAFYYDYSFRELQFTRFPDMYLPISGYDSHLNIRSISSDRQNPGCSLCRGQCSKEVFKGMEQKLGGGLTETFLKSNGQKSQLRVLLCFYFIFPLSPAFQSKAKNKNILNLYQFHNIHKQLVSLTFLEHSVSASSKVKCVMCIISFNSPNNSVK